MFAYLFDKGAGVGHETGHCASDVAEGEGVRNARKRTQWCLEKKVSISGCRKQEEIEYIWLP